MPSSTRIGAPCASASCPATRRDGPRARRRGAEGAGVRLPIGTLTCSSPPDRQRRARALSRRQRGDPGGRTVRRWRPIPGGGPRAAAGIPAGPGCRLGARWPADPARPPRSSSTVQAKQVRVRIAQGGGVSAGPRASTRGGRGRPRSGRLSAPLFLRTPGANLLSPDYSWRLLWRRGPGMAPSVARAAITNRRPRDIDPGAVGYESAPRRWGYAGWPVPCIWPDPWRCSQAPNAHGMPRKARATPAITTARPIRNVAGSGSAMLQTLSSA